MKILKDKGIFAYICSNKFAKAKYGEKLRKLILYNQLKIFNDFTGINVFKEASVDTCVIQIKKDYIENNEVFVDDNYFMLQNKLNSNSFIFNSPEVLNLRDKIFDKGIMIKDLDIEINRGILTGFNEAFIIDEETKNRLIREDSNNKEVIRPLLRGRDINKWKIMYKDLYIIFTRRGIEINNYPSIKKYLSQWKEELTPKTKNSKSGDKGRKPGPYKWYEIQDNVAYYAMFDKEKLIYPELSSSIHPAFDDKKYYIDKTCFMITSEKINIKYILALLSSKTLNFIFRLLGSPLGSSGYNLSKIFVEQLPLVFGDSIFEKELIELTDIIINKNTEYAFEKNLFFKKLINDFKILKISNKLNNFQKLDFKDFLKECEKQKVDTSNSTIKMNLENLFNLSSLKLINLENEINSLEIQLNKMVYKLYDLNENEIKLIEENLN